MRRQLLWRIPLAGVMAVIGALLVVALVPPWRDEALTTALLVTGQIGAPRDLRTVALCADRRRGLGAWLARRIIVPRGRVVAGTIAGEALHGAHRPYYTYLPPGYGLCPSSATGAIPWSTFCMGRPARRTIGTGAARSTSWRTASSATASWCP